MESQLSKSEKKLLENCILNASTYRKPTGFHGGGYQRSAYSKQCNFKINYKILEELEKKGFIYYYSDESTIGNVIGFRVKTLDLINSMDLPVEFKEIMQKEVTLTQNIF